jgi:hypothetical protein
MPERTGYAHGTPSWTDLSTTDVGAARAFYADLFGWEYVEESAGDEVIYVTARKRDRAVAGLFPQPPEMGEAGLPPMWSSYVSVDDLEATVAKVAPAGGAIVRPPMDVMDAGRMAVIADPTGGVLSLWEKKGSIGAELVNEHGALSWSELMSADVDRAAAFYHEVLGWDARTDPMPDGRPYTVFSLGEDMVAGAMAPPMDDVPTSWSVYFAVDDCDAVVDEARAGEGSIIVEPTDIPPGRFAVIADPQGAVFQVMQLAEPPA